MSYDVASSGSRRRRVATPSPCANVRGACYYRWPKLCEDLALARGDWRHPRLIRSLGRANLLILDDFGLEPLDVAARHNLLEILKK